MSGWTTYGAEQDLAGSAFPQTLYVKLHTGEPGVAGTANPATETTRKAITLEDGVENYQRTNDAGVTWDSLPATEVATHFTLWDAVTDGNAWAVGFWDPTLNLTLGGSLALNAGDIQIDIAPHAP